MGTNKFSGAFSSGCRVDAREAEFVTFGVSFSAESLVVSAIVCVCVCVCVMKLKFLIEMQGRCDVVLSDSVLPAFSVQRLDQISGRNPSPRAIVL